MVRYLGDIIAAQELAHEPRTIQILLGKQGVDLFQVKRGREFAVKAVGPMRRTPP